MPEPYLAQGLETHAGDVRRQEYVPRQARRDNGWVMPVATHAEFELSSSGTCLSH